MLRRTDMTLRGTGENTLSPAVDDEGAAGLVSTGDMPAKRRKKDVLYQNQSIDRVFAIMEVLGRSPYHLKLAEVARRCSLAPPTAYRMLSVMMRLGYVSKDPTTGRYSFGTRLYRLAHRETYLRSLVRLAQPHLQALAARIGETVHIAAFDGAQVVIRGRVPAGRSARVPTRVGLRVDAHACALGKAMLATRPAAEIAELFLDHPLGRHTASTLTTLGQLERDLAEARRRGFAVSRGERFDHVWCAAAPVLNSLGLGNIAISACLPSGRTTARDVERLGRLVRAAAIEIQEASRGNARLANRMG
ncbi:MAG: IclR family transcriptional regulator [Pseudomonadota bacterium]